MATKDEVIAAVQSMVAKIEDPDNPKLQKRFSEFNRTMLMHYKDLNLDVSIEFRSGTTKVTEGRLQNPDMTVTTDSKTILSILDGSTSAMRAFMTGKIKADGPIRDLMKIQHLLKG